MTQLYHTLTLVLIKRYMTAKGEWGEDFSVPDNLKDLPPQVNIRLKNVCELAYRGLFREEGVQLVFTKSDLEEGFQLLGLLGENKEMSVLGPRTSYSFLHLSIQEFLAAWHVSCHPELTGEVVGTIFYKDKDAFSIHVLIRSHLNTFGRFLAGLIGCDQHLQHLQLSIDRLGDIKSLGRDCSMYYIHCMYEAQDFNTPKACIGFSTEHCRFLEEFGCLTLTTPLDMYVFGYILVHAPIKWHIQIETSLDVLASSLIDHTPSDTEMLGSIEEITFKGIPIEDAKQLLPSLQKSVIKLVYLTLPMPTSTILTYDYSFLTNLQSVRLQILTKQDNYRLYQALRRIRHLTELY
jgi:hypothetical protein